MATKKKKKTSKKWSEYFLEFLMLFLAVSLGFFADNLRDSLSEKKTEKKYIFSMIEDVKNDRESLKVVISNNTRRKELLDSLSTKLLNYNYSVQNDSTLYKLFPIVMLRPDFFIPSTLTIEQLKNAGGMKLIKNKKAIDEILRYDLKGEQLKNQEKYYENYHNKSITLGTKVFNYKKAVSLMLKKVKNNSSSIKLIDNNKLKINELGNIIYMYKGIVEYYLLLLQETDKQANKMIEILEKEYKIK